MRLRQLILITLLALPACGSEPESTRGAYTAEQVSDLEIAGAARDPSALRELEIYYDMEGRREDSERIHRQRLEINDPEAIENEIMREIGNADRIVDCEDRRNGLFGAQQDALELARRQRLPNPKDGELYQLIETMLTETRC